MAETSKTEVKKSKIERYVDSLKRYFRSELARSGTSYLRLGLQLFHNQRKSSYPAIQPVIGNLAIAVELILKAFIARQNPGLLFTDLPVELKALFSSPSGIPDSFNRRQYDIDLKSFKYKTIELDIAVALFYIYFEEHKQLLQPYFKFLASIRNPSVHASLPSFQRYDMDRGAYLALSLLKIFNEAKAFERPIYFPTKDDDKFLESFDAQRIERVTQKIEAAKKRSRTLQHDSSSVSVDSWNLYVQNCPICDSDGVLSGYTHDSWDNDPENPTLNLIFSADSFECNQCGLVLNDVKELELAGIDTDYDRSDESDNWLRKHGVEIEDFPDEDFPDIDIDQQY